MKQESNIMIVNQPTFHWDGGVTDNDEAPIKFVNSYELNENFTIIDFLVEHKGRTVVFLPNNKGELIYDSNRIRAYVE